MPYLIILVILTIFLYIWLKKTLSCSFIKIKNNYEGFKNEYESLLQENNKLKTDDAILKAKVDETIVLYDITKQICKSLDEDEVFSNFCDQIKKYVAVSDCRFIKEELDLSQYKDHIVLPLNIDKISIGYLIASGINKEDEDKFNILAQQFLLGIKRVILYQRVQELAITDSLTGIFSRRYYLERLNEEIARSKKFKYRFSFLMVDIDHFKTYNDRYGHLVGDVILREVSKTIKENMRQIDLVGRYGGEEFSIILTETDKEGAVFAAERIRQAIENKPIRAYDEDLKVTVSIGISVFPSDSKDATKLIEKADQALYQAKHTGRNRVCVYGVK